MASGIVEMPIDVEYAEVVHNDQQEAQEVQGGQAAAVTSLTLLRRKDVV